MRGRSPAPHQFAAGFALNSLFYIIAIFMKLFVKINKQTKIATVMVSVTNKQYIVSMINLTSTKSKVDIANMIMSIKVKCNMYRAASSK